MATKAKFFEDLKHFRNDIPSGLVVFLVALPLCLGIALASGAPLFSGLISGVIGGLVIGSLSGSRYSVSGPAAGLTVIVLAAITDLGSFEIFLLAVLLAGAIQIVLGLIGAGILGLYFPTSVIQGMLAAIGLILILKQVPHLVGVDLQAFSELDFKGTDGRNTFEEFLYALEHIHPGALLVGALSFAIILSWDNLVLKGKPSLKIVPSALLAVVISILFNEFFLSNYENLFIGKEHLVNIPALGNGHSLADLIKMPDFGQIGNPAVWKTAAVIAIVASLETLLSLEAVDKLDPDKHTSPKNRELLAQGTGNMLSGLIGGLPITAVIVRSSANLAAGAKTHFSAVYHGFLLFAAVLLLPEVLNMIPLATLAVVLIVVGYKLTKPALYVKQWKYGYKQFIPFIITVVTVPFNLLMGVATGLFVAVYFILQANFQTAYFRKEEEVEGKKQVTITLSEHVSFLNKASLQDTLHRLPSHSRVIIDCTKTMEMDFDAEMILEDFKEQAEEKGIQLIIKKKNEKYYAKGNAVV